LQQHSILSGNDCSGKWPERVCGTSQNKTERRHSVLNPQPSWCEAAAGSFTPVGTTLKRSRVSILTSGRSAVKRTSRGPLEVLRKQSAGPTSASPSLHPGPASAVRNGFATWHRIQSYLRARILALGSNRSWYESRCHGAGSPPQSSQQFARVTATRVSHQSMLPASHRC
jgi:hypothetical protein